MDNWQYDFVYRYMEEKGVTEFKYEKVMKELPEDIKLVRAEEREYWKGFVGI